MGRVSTLLGIRFARGARERVPLSALFVQALLASFLCASARGSLPPYPYALFAFAVSGALVAIPLLGELGWSLRRDPASEWVGTLPVRARELALARLLSMLFLLGCLALASALPAALLAPDATSIGARLCLPFLGLGWILFLAALLLLVQALLGERAEGALVLFQTAVVVVSVVGVLLALRSVERLARLPALGDEGAAWLWLLPPAWFAAPLADGGGGATRLLPPVLAALAGGALLVALPAGAAPRRTARSWLGTLLAPARALALRWWVRREERGVFELVYEALPREREVVLRVVPLFGIPLGFLLLASSDTASAPRSDVLALLTFGAGAYLPVLLAHVPVSSTPEAAWILLGSPTSERALAEGTLKALAVRFLVPLYVLLALLTCVFGGPLAMLRLALPGFLVSLLCLRWLYRELVSAPPLSMPPEDVRFGLERFRFLGEVALVLTIVAVLANRFLTTPGAALLASAALLGALAFLGRNRAADRR